MNPSVKKNKPVRSLRNAHSLNFQEIASQKTILLVGRSELEQLVDFLFDMPEVSPDINVRAKISSRLKPAQQGASTSLSVQPGGLAPGLEKRPLAYSTRPHVGFFVDREDLLAQLQADLRDPQKVLLVIDGLAGIGKTTVAAKLAEEMENEFRGIYWTKCMPETDLDQLLAELAYFLSEHGDQTFANVFTYNIPKENKLNFLISSLSNLTGLGDLSGLKYLLIFDDVHELLDEQDAIKNDDLRLLFTRLLTQSHISKILLISRAHPQFYRLSGSQSKNTVASIRQQAGIVLLQQLGVDEDDDLLEQAYRLTAGHPLAMELLAKLAGVMPLEDILANTQLFWGDETVIEQLLQEFDARLSNAEKALLSTLSILPHPATREMIMFLTGNPNITPILTSLTKKVLLSFDRTQKIYKQHDLVRDFYRLKLDDQTKRAIHLKAAEYYEQFKKERENKLTFQEVEQRLSARYHYFQAGEYEKAAQVLVEVSEYLREWGYLERCRTLLEETLKTIEGLSPTRERQLLKVDLLVELSWVEERSEGIGKAFIRCKQSETILKSIDDKIRLGNLYHAMGRFYFQETLFKEAETFLNLSFEMKKQEEDTNGLVKVLEPLRELYMPMNLAKIDKIKQRCEEAIIVCEKKRKIDNKADILLILARALESQSRLQEALVIFEKSLTSCNDNNLIGKFYSLYRIGQILRKNEFYGHATKKYEESLIFAQKSGDLIFQGRSLQGIGDTYRDSGKIEDAVKKYEEAIEIMGHSTNLSGKASLFHDIALSYRDLGKFDEALKLLELSSQLMRELNNFAGLAVNLSRIGRIHAEYLSNLDIGLKFQRQCLEIRKQLRRGIYVEETEEHIGHVYKMKGELQNALKIFENLLKLKRKRGDYSRMRVLDHIGSIFCIKGKFQKALDFHKESLRLCEEAERKIRKSITLNHIGETYIRLGNYHEALTILEDSFELQREHYKKAEPLTNIADVYYRQDNLTEAMATCEESLALSRQYGGRIQAGKTLHLMAKIRLKEQRYDEALQYVREAADIFRDTGSRHLPEAEATLEELQNKKT
jgi:tetratricopeptide (TPR) repeat protein